MSNPILPRIARGESSAVDECLDRYGGLVWSLARRLAPDDPEDAAQEIFIDLWRNAGRFREGLGTETAFVSTVARRRLIDRRRRADRTPRALTLDPAVVAEAIGDPVVELSAAEDREQLRQCLAGLAARSRQAIELSVYEGLSQSRIAERLEAPLGTVKTLIRRALIQLRDCVRSARRMAVDGGAP